MADPAEVEVNVFDLTTQVVTPDSYVVGYIAAVKLLTEDGEMGTEFITHDMNNFEAVGILQALLDRLRASNAAYEAWDDEENEG